MSYRIDIINTGPPNSNQTHCESPTNSSRQFSTISVPPQEPRHSAAAGSRSCQAGVS